MDTLFYNGVVETSQNPSPASGVISFAPTVHTADSRTTSLIYFAAEGEMLLAGRGLFQLLLPLYNSLEVSFMIEISLFLEICTPTYLVLLLNCMTLVFL